MEQFTYEYKTVEVKQFSESEESILEREGNEGWLYCGPSLTKGHLVFCMKHEVLDMTIHPDCETIL